MSLFDPIFSAVSAVLWFWHQVFGLVLGPASGAAWVLSVVFLVLTLRALMIKPFLAQLRSARVMRTLAPQLADLRARHADDPARLLRETRALRREHGVSTLGAFLPALLQLPVFLGLLHVLNGFNRPGLSFEQNAAIANYLLPAGDVRSFLEARIFGTPLSAYVSMPQRLLDSFGANVERWEVVAVAVPLMLLAAVATHFSARHSLAQQVPGQQPEVASVLRLMPWIFPLGVLVGGAFFPFPVAILVYWLTNNAWTLAQQHLAYRRPDRQPVVAPPGEPLQVGSLQVGSLQVGSPQVGSPPVELPPVGSPPMTRGGGSPPRRRHSSGHRSSRRRR